MRWVITKHRMQCTSKKFSIFTLKKQMLNSLKITAEAAIFASLPISFSQVIFSQYYTLFEEPKKYLNFKWQLYTPNFLCYLDVIRYLYIGLTVKLPLVLRVHVIVSFPACRFTFAIVAIRLFHSSNLFPIRALLKETLKGIVLNTLAIVACFFVNYVE